MSLSLPGLILDPQADGAGLPAAVELDLLPQQYRFDLPYADEINALAQLPEPPPRSRSASPPCPTPPCRSPRSPYFATPFQDQWRQLSQQASLASADAVSRLRRRQWRIPYPEPGGALYLARRETGLDLSVYPGKLTLANRTGTNGTSLLLAGRHPRGVRRGKRPGRDFRPIQPNGINLYPGGGQSSGAAGEWRLAGPAGTGAVRQVS